MLKNLSIALLSLMALLICLSGYSTNADNQILSVNEANCKILLTPQTKLLLSVKNHTNRSIDTQVRIEILDPQDNVSLFIEANELLKPGVNVVTIPITSLGDNNQVLWQRLRYQLSTPIKSNVLIVGGIIGLTNLIDQFFNITLTAPEYGLPGNNYQVRIIATHPLTGKPIKNVELNGKVVIDYDSDDDEAKALKAQARTNQDGIAILEFDLPAGIEGKDCQLAVAGKIGLLTQSTELNINVKSATNFLVSTDKMLYRPGQIMHARVLTLDINRQPLKDKVINFTIEDERGEELYQTNLQSSKFGVCNLDWPIPANAQLGTYQITIKRDDDDSSDEKLSYFKVSRYELPNFTVMTKPDRAYYLPDQQAEIEVRADYLFGKPVTQGRVRVVRETEREWDYQLQRYEIEEGVEVRGQADNTGRFIAKFDLKAEFDEIDESDYYNYQPIYRDLDYVAYYTDLTTNRTEERRFKIRITKQPIHLYIINQQNYISPTFPVELYLSTYYADGTPAQCEVTINQQADSERDNSYSYENVSDDAKFSREAGRVKTNRYGVAKVTLDKLDLPLGSYRFPIKLKVSDKQGNKGDQINYFYVHNSSHLRVTTEKPIYQPNEPLVADISTNGDAKIVQVSLFSNNHILRSEIIKLRNGHGRVTFPYTSDFKGIITLTTDVIDPEQNSYNYYYWDTKGSCAVAYPYSNELKIDVKFDQASYQPGQNATATVKVQSERGEKFESLLGAVIFDKAVAERYYSNIDRDDRYSYYGGPSEFTDDYQINLYKKNSALSGISVNDILNLDPLKPRTQDYDLVAEILLNTNFARYNRLEYSRTQIDTNLNFIFSSLIFLKTKMIEDRLKKHFDEQLENPFDQETLRRILTQYAINFDAFSDPWGMPFQARFTVDKALDRMTIICSGPDKQLNTDDDFEVLNMRWPYLKKVADATTRALQNYQLRTNKIIIDEATLTQELQREGIDLTALRDRWQRPYQIKFDTYRDRLAINYYSYGADGKPDAENPGNRDDFSAWAVTYDYFANLNARINNALVASYKETKQFPQNEIEFNAVLQRANIDLNELRDLNGNKYYLVFLANKSNEFGNYVSNGNFLLPNNPVTNPPANVNKSNGASDRSYKVISVRSIGADNQANSLDDFQVAEFTQGLTELRVISKSIAVVETVRSDREIAFQLAGLGRIDGIVVDATGAVIAGTEVTVTNTALQISYKVTANENGLFYVLNLPAGDYDLQCTSPGFVSAKITNIKVTADQVTKVKFEMAVGGTAEIVEVSGGDKSVMVETSQTMVSSQVAELRVNRSRSDRLAEMPQMSTPRLREDFPETLLWQPEINVDRRGRAQINFKLADNITTWKLAIVGSTIDGKLGFVEKEFTAIQPFFIEHEPPQVLTVGDEINLPVVLRNYLNQSINVNVGMKPESWFTLLSNNNQQCTVPTNDAAKQFFNFRADQAIKQGKQRVTAIGKQAGDAIEKPIAVHPDGEEILQTDSLLYATKKSLDVDLPKELISGSIDAELKIYPNLMTHALEGIEGILKRPNGCAEQTISSTYPNLMVLKYLKEQEQTASPIYAKAEKNLRDGYERMLTFQNGDGSFGYWHDASGDIALTAYALKFLFDVEGYLNIDSTVKERTQQWLADKQQPDGSWPSSYYNIQDALATYQRTAYITRILAMTNTGAQSETLKRACNYLNKLINTNKLDEPYLLANYALALSSQYQVQENDDAILKDLLARLRKQVIHEGPISYWDLSGYTPFYGWGRAGRIETTALVLQALKKNTVDDVDNDLINRGLYFLMRNKDRYGVWYSTQATINVLDTLITLTSSAEEYHGEKLALIINGQQVQQLQLPQSNELSLPRRIDISQHLKPGQNQVEVRQITSADSEALSNTTSLALQANLSYYLPWQRDNQPNNQPNNKRNSEQRAGEESQSRAVKLYVSFDKTSVAVDEDITCYVKAARLDKNSYGMLLGEIGLPPGVVVDTKSLDVAKEMNGTFLYKYEVLPDRVIVYLWPYREESFFQFKLRARYGIKALNAPSLLYDYYNPDARITIAPTRFIVK